MRHVASLVDKSWLFEALIEKANARYILSLVGHFKLCLGVVALGIALNHIEGTVELSLSLRNRWRSWHLVIAIRILDRGSYMHSTLWRCL